MAEPNSNTHLLEELESLSQSLYQTHISTTNRRTASFAAPRTSVPSISALDEIKTAKIDEKSNTRVRSRRMSLSPWRSRPKLDDEDEQKNQGKVESQPQIKIVDEKATSTAEKKGIWNWKPIRALSHIGKQKLSCLFSVEVVTVQGLPSSMNGLRLSVRVRKKETKEGAVNTMPSRVSQGAADFEETLFVKCHVYYTPGNGKQMKFEPRPFWIYVFAVDAEELDFGQSSVDLSHLIQKSIEKSFENSRVRQWDMSFNLSGKAKGGELVLKLGFQIMEKDGGIGIYTQAEGSKANKSKNLSSSFGRKQSKTSFSIPSPKMTSRSEAWTPSQTKAAADLQGMDDLNLDEPAPVPTPAPPLEKLEKAEPKIEDDIPDFEVVDKGIEIEENEEIGEESSEANTDVKSASSEVVKEVVHDQLHLVRLTELDSIAQQIKALESMMGEERTAKMEDETGSQRLDEEEETVTKEFLQMLEEEEAFEFKLNDPEIIPLQLDGADNSIEADSKVFLPDLGKGLGCVVQTRDGGYLAAMNPLDTLVDRKDTPKLAMQMSKPLVIQSQNSTNGFELFQKLAAIGLEEFSSQIFSLMPMEELMGKAAEQIAFEGIASAIIQGRNKEGASSSAARIIAAVKDMATAMSTGRRERISTGIWNVNENPLRAEEILAFSLQKIEAMAVQALKVQADMSEEEAPFDVSPLGEKGHDRPLDSAVPVEDWIKKYSLITPQKEVGEPTIFLAVVVQLRDPLRRYEAVGGPVVALIHASYANTKVDKYDEEKRFKVTSAHIGGLKVSTGGRKNIWVSERQRLTAIQWLVAYGVGKAGKKGNTVLSRGQDLLWSISSRVMADMWLKEMRNPDIRFAN
ncbi:Plastid movement impaired1 [Tripterygium wilfordii]|uniref:Plastid movement impaired1 n=1 Tax=Tripterygium wilfordii TaxID=458696 RepID=A0A7J7D3Y2_TRIWF|nr:protein PLASTID MOVEMENT IMPAIRED 1 [Tripterygium wilfordii]KAF5740978.1 Plastid movement impaired1 [Tripterygium wilfordii]